MRLIGSTLVLVSVALVSCQRTSVRTSKLTPQQQYDRTDVAGYLLPDLTGRLLAAKAQQIAIGDTKEEVIRILGKRTDEGHLDAWDGPQDDSPVQRAAVAHPELHFLHWARSCVSVYADFTKDGRVFGIRYYDDRLSPKDGPYRRKQHNNGIQRTANRRR